MILLSSLLASAFALEGVLEVPVKIHEIEKPLFRREFEGEIQNLRTFYYGTKISIGKPAQDFDVILDTGSSDIFVFSPASHHKPYFNWSISESAQMLTLPPYSASFQPEAVTAKGQYWSDVVEFAGVKVEDTPFAVLDNDIPKVFDGLGGLFGIAGRKLEASQQKYDNFPAKLVSEGITDHNGYSVYLGPRDANTGALVFGGVDSAKYRGPMHLFKNKRPQDTFMGVDVTVNGISENALLDTGTQFCYLNSRMIDSLAVKYNATYDPKKGLWVPDPGPNPAPFEFKFGDFTVKVPYEEFLADPSNPHVVSIFKTSESGGIALLGAAFMRQVYVIYDYDRNQVGLAQANDSDETRLSKLSDPIPRAIMPKTGLFDRVLGVFSSGK